MVWAAIIPAVASLAGSAMSYFGSQQANSANAAMANAQMQFQAAQGEHQEAFAREMFQRQTGFAAGQADQAYYRNLGLYHDQNRIQAENRDLAMAFGREMTGRQEQFQREMAQQAMDYNLMTSSTAYQRAAADMRAAGINPMLAYQRGGAAAAAAPAPSGATASAPTPSGASGGFASPAANPSAGSRSAMSGAMARMENIMGPAVQSALQSARIFGEVQQLAANVEQTREQTALTQAEQARVRVGTTLLGSQELTERERRELVREQTRTEPTRRGQLSASARSSVATAVQGEQEAERFRLFGPRGTIPDLLASGEAIGRRAAPHVPGTARAIEEGARALPEALRPPTHSPETMSRVQSTNDQINYAFRRLMDLFR